MILRQHRARRRGATVVETALVLSIFLLFFIGILEYGRFLMFMHVASNATMAGARYAVVHTGDGTTLTQVQTLVTDSMAGRNADLTGYAVTCFASQTGVSPPTAIGGKNWNDAAFAGGICVKITGTYTFTAGALLGMTPFAVTVHSTMSSEAN